MTTTSNEPPKPPPLNPAASSPEPPPKGVWAAARSQPFGDWRNRSGPCRCRGLQGQVQDLRRDRFDVFMDAYIRERQAEDPFGQLQRDAEGRAEKRKPPPLCKGAAAHGKVV